MSGVAAAAAGDAVSGDDARVVVDAHHEALEDDGCAPGRNRERGDDDTRSQDSHDSAHGPPLCRAVILAAAFLPLKTYVTNGAAGAASDGLVGTGWDTGANRPTPTVPGGAPDGPASCLNA